MGDEMDRLIKKIDILIESLSELNSTLDTDMFFESANNLSYVINNVHLQSIEKILSSVNGLTAVIQRLSAYFNEYMAFINLKTLNLKGESVSEEFEDFTSDIFKDLIKDLIKDELKNELKQSDWSALGNITGITTAIALIIDIFASTSTSQGAEEYLESMTKFDTFAFNDMDEKDWKNALVEIALATIGISGTKIAKDNKVYEISSSIMEIPQRENFATEEEYNKAVEEFLEIIQQYEREYQRIPGVEYDENGWNKNFVELMDKIVAWWKEMSASRGAEGYLDSLTKFDDFAFDKMDADDWINILADIALATVGISGSRIAENNTVHENSNIMEVPKRENYATEEEYKKAVETLSKAIEEYQKEYWLNPSVEYDETGWNTNLVEIKDKIVSWWNDEVITWWENTGMPDWWNNNVIPWFSKEKWDGISGGLSEAWGDALDSNKKQWNEFAKWMNENLIIYVDSDSVIGREVSAVLGTTKISLVKMPTFKMGGFPEDGLFMANHNELIGQFSDGRTVVANNEQITEGIEEAAYNAMIRALEENKSSVDVTFRVEGDPQGLVRIMKQEERAYYQRTGKMLFVQ